MIEIIKEEVEMPNVISDRRFQKTFENNKWIVLDSHNDNKIRYVGSFENVTIACYNLNKKFYLDGFVK